ncbi:hypothetical protein VTL71DRAFT_9293, partial [Oculimacula yallundae]
MAAAASRITLHSQGAAQYLTRSIRMPTVAPQLGLVRHLGSSPARDLPIVENYTGATSGLPLPIDSSEK